MGCVIYLVVMLIALSGTHANVPLAIIATVVFFIWIKASDSQTKKAADAAKEAVWKDILRATKADFQVILLNGREETWNDMNLSNCHAARDEDQKQFYRFYLEYWELFTKVKRVRKVTLRDENGAEIPWAGQFYWKVAPTKNNNGSVDDVLWLEVHHV